MWEGRRGVGKGEVGLGWTGHFSFGQGRGKDVEPSNKIRTCVKQKKCSNSMTHLIDYFNECLEGSSVHHADAIAPLLTTVKESVSPM